MLEKVLLYTLSFNTTSPSFTAPHPPLRNPHTRTYPSLFLCFHCEGAERLLLILNTGARAPAPKKRRRCRLCTESSASEAAEAEVCLRSRRPQPGARNPGPGPGPRYCSAGIHARHPRHEVFFTEVLRVVAVEEAVDFPPSASMTS